MTHNSKQARTWQGGGAVQRRHEREAELERIRRHARKWQRRDGLLHTGG